MAIRKYKPTTPGRRGSSVADFAEVTRDHPEKSLVRPLHGRGGRNVHGKVTARHQGGGHKRAYRVIDFRRADKDGVPAKVGQSGEPFGKEVRKSPGIRAGWANPAGVLCEDRGFYAATD